MTLVLEVTPVFCGEASVGTVGLVKLLRRHLICHCQRPKRLWIVACSILKRSTFRCQFRSTLQLWLTLSARWNLRPRSTPPFVRSRTRVRIEIALLFKQESISENATKRWLFHA